MHTCHAHTKVDVANKTKMSRPVHQLSHCGLKSFGLFADGTAQNRLCILCFGAFANKNKKYKKAAVKGQLKTALQVKCNEQHFHSIATFAG